MMSISPESDDRRQDEPQPASAASSSRREFLKNAALAVPVAATAGCTDTNVPDAKAGKRPNILLCISDDQSYPHASAYGYKATQTPHFDRVANEGVLFTGAFAASPGCSPCRAALLSGRHTWQIENAGTHASSFPASYPSFQDLLEQAGYFTGYTGKPWGPGRWEDDRPRNPAGDEFNQHKGEPPLTGLRSTDYATNFLDFLSQRPEGQPFSFWFGASEPHRRFEQGSGLRAGKKLEDADPPPFLPDRPEIRSDILDYAVEIEWFDFHLGRMLNILEEMGELENTLVIVTSDNGMAFPRAKANVYEYGTHVPLAIRWGERVPAGRVVDDLVGFVDLSATILEASGVADPGPGKPPGRSILSLLESGEQGVTDPSRDAVYCARERHSSSRYNNATYPQRSLRTHQHLYIRNFKPERWPAGAPQKYDDENTLGPMHGAYHDIDASPTLDFLIANRDDAELGKYFHLAVDKRPAEELFDIIKDPGCLTNLAEAGEFDDVRKKLGARLEAYLEETGDPRLRGNGDVWESYKRYSLIRKFPAPSG